MGIWSLPTLCILTVFFSVPHGTIYTSACSAIIFWYHLHKPSTQSSARSYLRYAFLILPNQPSVLCYTFLRMTYKNISVISIYSFARTRVGKKKINTLCGKYRLSNRYFPIRDNTFLHPLTFEKMHSWLRRFWSWLLPKQVMTYDIIRHCYYLNVSKIVKLIQSLSKEHQW